MGLLPVDHPAVMYYSTIKILPEKTFKSVFDNLKEILDKKVITID